MSNIDLRKCVRGQKLKSQHGLILTYVEAHVGGYYDHIVEYPNGGRGTRTHEGHTYRIESKRLPEDHDIVEILPVGAI
jgi:hypothetical protein